MCLPMQQFSDVTHIKNDRGSKAIKKGEGKAKIVMEKEAVKGSKCQIFMNIPGRAV